jgi:hypothetical protein
VNHILQTFQARGFLTIRGREVLILDLAALRRRGSR